MSQDKSSDATPTDLDGLIEQLCQYLDEHRVQFTGKQLNDTGDLYEKYDFSTARMVAEGKEDPNTAALVHILSQVHRAKLSPDKASYLIRHLNQIRTHRR
jgi:hypothetical protein